jgi:hypothetical protein
VWGAGGVSLGDTLYVCGAHTYGASISVGAHLAASEPERVTISGAAPEESGSITFSASGTFTLARAWTTLRDISVFGFNANVPVVDISLNSTQNRIVRSRIVGGGNGLCVQLNATASTSLADIRIEDCEFSGQINSGQAIIHLNALAAGSVVICDGLTVSGCSFSVTNAKQGVRVFFAATVDATSKVRNFVAKNNRLTRCSTAFIIFNAAGRPITNEGLSIRGNDVRDLPVDAAGEGGLALLTGVTSSAELGAPRVEGNRAINMVGTWGGVFFNDCTGLEILNNYFDGITTTTAQNRGHGVAVSSAVTGAVIADNVFRNIVGVASADSGAAINFRGGGASVAVYNNLVIGCDHFIRSTNAGAGCVVEHNTAFEVRQSAIENTGATINNVVARNNFFVAGLPAAESVNNSSTAWTNENFNAFCGFAAPVGHSLGANSITPSLPKLTDGGKPDAGSVLEGAGTTTTRTTDFLGAARSATTPTIGVMEAEAAALARDSGDTIYSGAGPQSPVVPELWQNVPRRARLKYRNHWRDSPWYSAG